MRLTKEDQGPKSSPTQGGQHRLIPPWQVVILQNQPLTRSSGPILPLESKQTATMDGGSEELALAAMAPTTCLLAYQHEKNEEENGQSRGCPKNPGMYKRFCLHPASKSSQSVVLISFISVESMIVDFLVNT